MSELSKSQTIYYKELEYEMNNLHSHNLIIGIKDLSKKFKFDSINQKPTKEKVYRTKYKFDKKIFDDGDNNEIEQNNEFLLPIEYEYTLHKEEKNLNLKNNKENKIKKELNIIGNIKDISENNKEDEDLEKKNENEENEEGEENEERDKKKIIKNIQKENYEIFGDEEFPPDDEPFYEPPVKAIEVSDIELEEEEEIEDVNSNNANTNKNNQILVPSESTAENNLQFTEHILNQVHSPIDMITIGEKVYELCNKKDNSNKKIDLSPLSTYKKNNIININLFKELNMTGQYNQFLKDGKLFLDDYISSDQKEEVPTAMIIDNRDYKTNCSIWFGTNKSKLIKIPICSRPSKDCQGMVMTTEEVGITSIDIFENFLIMGYKDGGIQIMEDQKIIDKTKDIKCEILQIKFIKINSKKKKYEFIYSTSNGIVNYVKKAKTLIMSRNINEQIISCKEFPVYKICLFSKEKDLKIIKKKNILIALVSLKNVSLYKIRPKSQNQNIAIIEIPYCNIGDFVFDCDFGLGYPPLSDIKVLKEKEQKRQISLIENALIEEGKKESILIVVSYGIVIRLFEIKFGINYNVEITEVGYYITEFPIYRLGFITKSYITIIDSKNCLQLINTFCFENEIYKEVTSPTKNSIINYNKIDLTKFLILKQNNIFFNSKDGKRYAGNTNYLGSVLIFEQNIFIISKQKFILYKLLRWDEVIKNLCQNEEYEKMIWLSTFILGKNQNLFSIESEENILEEYEHSLQESLYIFLIKGTSEQNNYKELRMLIEYCIYTGRFKDFYKAKDTLGLRKLDHYLYDYTTEYIFNGNFLKFEFETDFLKEFINYYLGKNAIILLSKILLKISVNNLNKPEIIKILEENEIINPFLYAKIKDNEDNKSDYFKPVQYLYSLFEKKKKNNQNEKEEIIRKEYFKLITEHDMKYYYDKTLSCNDYMGHKLLWYINKCLLNEEFPKGNPLPNDAFELICKKIMLFLTLDNTMEILLQFDSFSYFILLTKLFTESKLYRIMDMDIDKRKFPYAGLETFVKQYLGNISIEYLSEKYFYYQIKLFIDGKKDIFKNIIYIKFDFFQMTANICKERKNIFIDRGTIIDAIKFFIDYEILLEGEKSKEYYDPYNCHKIPNKDEVLYKDFSDNIENNILYLLKSLQSNQDFFENDLDELFSLEGLKKHNKIKSYLSEYGRKYEELFKVKLEEYKNQNPSLTKEDNLKKFFNWINETLNITNEMGKKNSKKRYYFIDYKNFIKSKLLELSQISIKYSFDIIDNWFNEDEEAICYSLNLDELKYAYLDNYVILHSQQEETDKKYEIVLHEKIDLLLKHNYKEQIIKIVEKYRILWTNEIFNIMIKNEVYDAAIFISQKRDNIEKCMKLSVNKIEKIFNDIRQSLLEYKESVNSDIIFIKFEEIKKYLDLALTSCASWTEANQNYSTNDVNNTWMILLDLFYKFKNELSQEIKDNRLTLKYKSTSFNSIFEKVIQNILEIIEYILSIMSDYIPLSFIVKVLCQKLQNSKFKEYSKMFQRIFYSTRGTEEIFKSISSLLFNSLLQSEKFLLNESQKGFYSDMKKCNLCEESIDDIIEINSIIYFKCGHMYHNLCCPIEKGQYACYVCRTEEMEESSYTEIPNLIFRKKENVLNYNKEDKIRKIKEKKTKKKNGLLEKLKKIKKKKYEKIEAFKSNIDNSQIS